jgi:hypothetical protein
LQGNTGTATSAAALADSYTVTVSGVVYDDWYLPSRDELKQMCRWQGGLDWTSNSPFCIGGMTNTGLGAAGFEQNDYWSSSEAASSVAWLFSFDNGNYGGGGKGGFAYVRPIRAGTTRTTPVFNLSSTSETLTARTSALNGYTISSTGGTITSYSISPSAPPGLSFSESTGLLSGTPTETRSATTYTITGSNSYGSATATFRLRVTGDIGDTGPGGGIIFYVSTTPFACGPSLNLTCRYLEAAPNSWNGGPEPLKQWADDVNIAAEVSGIGESIGMGYRNTRAIEAQGNPTSAAALADAYTVTVGATVIDDWYLPSNKELEQLVGQSTVVGGFQSGRYWASYQFGAEFGWLIQFPDGTQEFYFKETLALVRPIRAF